MAKLNTFHCRKGGLILALIVLLLISAISGTVLAKYIAANRYQAEMLSSDFHISSDSLVSDGIDLEVSDWNQRGIVIELYNFEKENIAQISGPDITYQITKPDGWHVTVKNGNDTIGATDGFYTLPGGNQRITHTIIVEPKSGTTGTVTVTAMTPYKKVLSATYTLVGTALPDYKIEDRGNYALLIISSNAYSGSVSVDWDENYVSPDHSNDTPNLTGWSDESSKNSFTVTPFTTYELIFIKNTNTTIPTAQNTGNEIVIGGE